MHISSKENYPPEPQYDPQALLGSLCLQDIDELDAKLDPLQAPVWHEVVNEVRSAIYNELAKLPDIINNSRQPDALPYDPEKGPVSYIATLRQENMATPEFTRQQCRSFHYGPWQENARLLEASRQYVLHHAAEIPAHSGSRANTMTSSFANNVSGLLVPPRMHARQLYHDDITHIWQKVSPELPMAVGRAHVSLAALEEAQKAIDKLPFPLRIPDYFQMEPSHQAEVVEALGREWIELCTVLHSVSPKLLGDHFRDRAPLAVLGVEELEHSLKARPPEMHVRICQAFLDSPRDFKEQLASLDKQHDYGAKLTSSAYTIPDPEQPLSEILVSHREGQVTENMQIIHDILKDPRVRPDILDLAPGMECALTEQDQIIPFDDLDPILDLHLELLGRALNEAHPNKNPLGAHLGRWSSLSADTLLRGKFVGNMRNLRVARLPVTEDYLRTHYKAGYDPIKISISSVARLLVTAEQKSASSRVPPLAAAHILVSSRKNTQEADIINKSVRKASANGLAESQRLIDESAARAQRIEGYNLRHSFRVGLPGLGRR